MTARAALWQTAAGLVRDGVPGALATVARRRGSLPMATDAKMLVTADGRRRGTIGGGCLEADVTAQALQTLETGAPGLVRHTLNADLAGDLGLSCGGTVELFVEPLVAAPRLAALLDEVGRAVASRRPATVFTARHWPDGPRKAVHVDGREIGVGDWTPAPTAEEDGGPGAWFDERTETFVEPVPRTPRLVVFGAGHVGREIARVAAATDFHLVVTDDRAEFANADALPWADEVIVGDPRAVADGLGLDADDHVVVATRGHRMDAVVVERVAVTPARYVGLLGSRRKQAVLWKALAAAGVPEEALRRVRVPVGLDIGADTPGEIAVAVVAEVIRERRSAAQPLQQHPE